MKPATTIAACITAFLLGLSVFPPADPSYITPEYGELLEKSREQQATILSLEYSIANLQAEAMTYKSQAEECKTKADSLTVQLAESQKARQRPEASPMALPAACATVPPLAAAVPSAVPYQPVYQRRGLFGRLRNR